MQSVSKRNSLNNQGKVYAILIATIIVFSTIIYTNASNGRFSAIQIQEANHSHKNPTGTIDGSIDPSLIPDNKAYSLLLRFLSKRNEARDNRLVETFIKDMGIKDEDVKVLIAASTEFSKLINNLDSQAAEIKLHNRNNMGLEVIAKLRLLDQQKDSTVTNIVAPLPERMHSNSIDNLRRYMNERFKRNMKIVPPAVEQSR